MKHRLEEPVAYGDVRLAPTIELAGLAELSSIRGDDERLKALLRIAEAVRAEDEARTQLAAVRDGTADLAELPRRR